MSSWLLRQNSLFVKHWSTWAHQPWSWLWQQHPANPEQSLKPCSAVPRKANTAQRVYNSAGHAEWSKPCYPHFASGNPDTEKLSDLPKVTPEVCGQSQSHEAQSSALTTHQLLSFMWWLGRSWRAADVLQGKATSSSPSLGSMQEPAALRAVLEPHAATGDHGSHSSLQKKTASWPQPLPWPTPGSPPPPLLYLQSANWKSAVAVTLLPRKYNNFLINKKGWCSQTNQLNSLGLEPLLLFSSCPNAPVTSSVALDTSTSRDTERLTDLRSFLIPSVQHCNRLTWEAAWSPDPTELPLISWTALPWAPCWRKGFLRPFPAWTTPWLFLAIVLTAIAPSLAQNAHSQQATALMGCECLSSHLTIPVGSSPYHCCRSKNMWMSQSMLTALDLARNYRTWYRKVRARFCKSLSRERNLSDS